MGQAPSGLFDEDGETVFIGIGTLLNDVLAAKTPRARRRSYSAAASVTVHRPMRLTSAEFVYCVRGPLSARNLGLEPRAAVTDGAVLIRRLVAPSSHKIFKFSVMPHIANIADEAWPSTTKSLASATSTRASYRGDLSADRSNRGSPRRSHAWRDRRRRSSGPVDFLSYERRESSRSSGTIGAPRSTSITSRIACRLFFNPRRQPGDPLALARKLRYQVRREIVMKNRSIRARSQFRY